MSWCPIIGSEEPNGSLSCNLLLRNAPVLILDLDKAYIVSESRLTHALKAIFHHGLSGERDILLGQIVQ